MRKYGLLVLTMGIMLCSACGGTGADVSEQAETLGGEKIERKETTAFLLPEAETVRGEESVQAEGGQETKGGDDGKAEQAQESEGMRAPKEQIVRRQSETSVSVEKAAAPRVPQPSGSGWKDNVPVESPVQTRPTDQKDSASQPPEPEEVQEIDQKPEKPKAPEPVKESEPVEIPVSSRSG